MHLPEVASGGATQRLIDSLRYGLVALLLAVQLLAALILMSRLAAGALDTRGAFGLLAWALLTALLAGGTRVAWHVGVGSRTASADAIVALLPMAAVLVTAGATLFAGASLVVAVLALSLLAGEELAMHALFSTHWPLVHAWQRRNGAGGRFRFPVVRDPAPAHGDDASAGAALAADELQRLVRSRDAADCDVLAGLMATCFAAGQSTALLHVAFCPPFARVPQLDFRQVAGPVARIKVGQLLPHGARLEVKLAHAAIAPTRIVLQIRAQHPATIAADLASTVDDR